ncbi:hypothetical protein PAHAL_3G432800 [Panicum hallii]|jgi:hypothetical protein|uniref:DUF4220 domain-containing protein n=1 Tax=Panicum hallii TaxID=206008 RepID=A0A2S3HE12_9POAL|nr:uncharacterized protein LOC112886532 [Panicum hallii]XP_025808241.1 uncharacterized protein LOC112886532 [Panicum hallii]PAN21022.1 hypothetical protein PAHAL_3G432800 [Panicum hallii]PVH62931.1 hypothetical protein PAHAL_3G432800 [Panicum hallii]
MGDGVSRTGNCSQILKNFSQRTAGPKLQILRVNGLAVVDAVLAGILVGIGTYGPHYQHRPIIRSLYHGATTLFLPILSYVVSDSASAYSAFGKPQIYSFRSPAGTEVQYRIICRTIWHRSLAVILAVLVLIVAINTCAIVAADEREGRPNTGLPVVLLVRAIWTSYLGLPLILLFAPRDRIFQCLVSLMFALVYAKITLRCCALQEARSSVALGRNPRLIAGYMKHLRDGIQGGIRAADHFPPPLILMGEDRLEVERRPHGFVFKRMGDQQDGMNNHGLVTIDRVWRSDSTLLTSEPWLKEVCLGFSLFKLLRCRFAGYTAAEAGLPEAYSFCLHLLLKDRDHERALAVITEELSFLHAYYYSSTAVLYSNRWLPMLNISASLLTMSCCLLLAGMVMARLEDFILLPQVICHVWCGLHSSDQDKAFHRSFGNLLCEMVPVLILLVVVVLGEARHVASYICSNWTKVALICHYVVDNHGALQQSPPLLQSWIGPVLRCRCMRLMKHWDDRMDQCSVLVLHSRTDPVALGMRLLRLPDKKHKVKVPRAVTKAIVDTIRSNNGLLTHPSTCLHRSLGVGDEGKSISGLILTWHIATSILGVRHQHHRPLSDDMVITTHLSRYCAYLVAYVPELLPDDDEWCKSLYRAVKKDSKRALSGGGLAAPAAEADYDKLVSLLQERAEHEVLRDGLKLGKELAELPEGEEAAWKWLARFWAGMILYIAPSDNLTGHALAIARGGELITLVWALLVHAGIAARPSATGPPATADDTV